MHFYCILVKLHFCFCSVSIKPVNGFSPHSPYISLSLSPCSSPPFLSPLRTHPFHTHTLPFFCTLSLHGLGRTALMLCFSRIHYSEYVPKTLLITNFFYLSFSAPLIQIKELLPIFFTKLPTSPTKHVQKAPMG